MKKISTTEMTLITAGDRCSRLTARYHRLMAREHTDRRTRRIGKTFEKKELACS